MRLSREGLETGGRFLAALLAPIAAAFAPARILTCGLRTSLIAPVTDTVTAPVAGSLALTDRGERTHVLAARTLAAPATLVPVRGIAALDGVGALSRRGRAGRLTCGWGRGRQALAAVLLSPAAARPFRPSRIARISRPGNGRLHAAVGVVHITAYGAAQSPGAASRRSLDFRWGDITSGRPVRQILFVAAPLVVPNAPERPDHVSLPGPCPVLSRPKWATATLPQQRDAHASPNAAPSPSTVFAIAPAADAVSQKNQLHLPAFCL
jgi:hypothetical protein